MASCRLAMSSHAFSSQGIPYELAQLYLEDVYEMTGYVLEAGSPAALRGDGRQQQRQQLQKGAASKQTLLKARQR